MTDERWRDDERWRQADRLFTAALELPAGYRDEFVMRECGADDALLARVRRLLEATAAEGILDEPAAVLAGSLEELFPGDDDDADLDTAFGPYRLVRLLGRGGTGSVYLGERADGLFAQQVAVKVLRRGLDTEDVLRRFAAERRILGALQHPDIARLLDGGATPDGRPYMVMERVEGLPITEHCEERQLTVRQRLELFARVARAVGHAHRSLVIHRDIKPTNILVTGAGEPRLLDFGIAKLLGAESDDELTRTGWLPLTPAWASPEQLQGGVVTTGSDVYQLGVLLYVLLTGRLPFEGLAGQRAAPRGTTTFPAGQRPSAAIRRLSEQPVAPPTTAGGGAGRWLGGGHVRDVDTIIATCLEHEPGRRYPSADALAEDVERFLSRRPIIARSPTLLYRLRRFTARRPVLVGAGVAAALALGGYGWSISAYAARLQRERDRSAAAYDAAEGERARALATLEVALVEADRAGRARDAAEQARLLEADARLVAEAAGRAAEVARARTAAALQRAEEEEARAEQAAAFLVSLFSVPGVPRADTLSARGVLDIGVRRINDDLVTDPRTRSALLLSIGEAYQNLGAGPAALDLLEEALQLHVRMYGATDARSLNSLQRLALARQEAAHHERARELWERLIALREQQRPVDAVRLSGDLRSLALLLRNMGHTDSALVVLDRSLSLRSPRAAGEPDPDLAQDLADRAYLLRTANQFDSAALYYRRALELMGAGEAQSWNSSGMVGVLNNYGFLLRRMERPTEAEAAYRRALDLQRGSGGDLHPQTQTLMLNLARVLQDQGRHDEAEAQFRARIDAAQRAWGPESWQAGAAHGELGAHFFDNGRHPEAESIFRKVVAINATALSPEHSWTANARHWVGRALAAQRRFEAAESELLAGLELLGRATDDAARRYERNVRSALVELYEAWGRPDRAAPYRDPPQQAPATAPQAPAPTGRSP
jgi:eukaryotic-like serine/threonine-protein kinase